MVPRNKMFRGYAINQTDVYVKANGKKNTGKPDAGNPPVRFDEGGGTPSLLYIPSHFFAVLVIDEDKIEVLKIEI
jgi:hypothetical protein